MTTSRANPWYVLDSKTTNWITTQPAVEWTPHGWILGLPLDDSNTTDSGLVVSEQGILTALSPFAGLGYALAHQGDYLLATAIESSTLHLWQYTSAWTPIWSHPIITPTNASCGWQVVLDLDWAITTCETGLGIGSIQSWVPQFFVWQSSPTTLPRDMCLYRQGSVLQIAVIIDQVVEMWWWQIDQWTATQYMSMADVVSCEWRLNQLWLVQQTDPPRLTVWDADAAANLNLVLEWTWILSTAARLQLWTHDDWLLVDTGYEQWAGQLVEIGVPIASDQTASWTWTQLTEFVTGAGSINPDDSSEWLWATADEWQQGKWGIACPTLVLDLELTTLCLPVVDALARYHHVDDERLNFIVGDSATMEWLNLASPLFQVEDACLLADLAVDYLFHVSISDPATSASCNNAMLTVNWLPTGTNLPYFRGVLPRAASEWQQRHEWACLGGSWAVAGQEVAASPRELVVQSWHWTANNRWQHQDWQTWSWPHAATWTLPQLQCSSDAWAWYDGGQRVALLHPDSMEWILPCDAALVSWEWFGDWLVVAQEACGSIGAWNWRNDTQFSWPVDPELDPSLLPSVAAGDYLFLRIESRIQAWSWTSSWQHEWNITLPANVRPHEWDASGSQIVIVANDQVGHWTLTHPVWYWWSPGAWTHIALAPTGAITLNDTHHALWAPAVTEPWPVLQVENREEWVGRPVGPCSLFTGSSQVGLFCGPPAWTHIWHINQLECLTDLAQSSCQALLAMDQHHHFALSFAINSSQPTPLVENPQAAEDWCWSSSSAQVQAQAPGLSCYKSAVWQPLLATQAAVWLPQLWNVSVLTPSGYLGWFDGQWLLGELVPSLPLQTVVEALGGLSWHWTAVNPLNHQIDLETPLELQPADRLLAAWWWDRTWTLIEDTQTCIVTATSRECQSLSFSSPLWHEWHQTTDADTGWLLVWDTHWVLLEVQADGTWVWWPLDDGSWLVLPDPAPLVATPPPGLVPGSVPPGLAAYNTSHLRLATGTMEWEALAEQWVQQGDVVHNQRTVRPWAYGLGSASSWVTATATGLQFWQMEGAQWWDRVTWPWPEPVDLTRLRSIELIDDRLWCFWEDRVWLWRWLPWSATNWARLGWDSSWHEQQVTAWVDVPSGMLTAPFNASLEAGRLLQPPRYQAPTWNLRSESGWHVWQWADVCVPWFMLLPNNETCHPVLQLAQQQWGSVAVDEWVVTAWSGVTMVRVVAGSLQAVDVGPLTVAPEEACVLFPSSTGEGWLDYERQDCTERLHLTLVAINLPPRPVSAVFQMRWGDVMQWRLLATDETPQGDEIEICGKVHWLTTPRFAQVWAGEERVFPGNTTTCEVRAYTNEPQPGVPLVDDEWDYEIEYDGLRSAATGRLSIAGVVQIAPAIMLVEDEPQWMVIDIRHTAPSTQTIQLELYSTPAIATSCSISDDPGGSLLAIATWVIAPNTTLLFNTTLCYWPSLNYFGPVELQWRATLSELDWQEAVTMTWEVQAVFDVLLWEPQFTVAERDVLEVMDVSWLLQDVDETTDTGSWTVRWDVQVVTTPVRLRIPPALVTAMEFVEGDGYFSRRALFSGSAEQVQAAVAQLEMRTNQAGVAIVHLAATRSELNEWSNVSWTVQVTDISRVADSINFQQAFLIVNWTIIAALLVYVLVYTIYRHQTNSIREVENSTEEREPLLATTTNGPRNNTSVNLRILNTNIASSERRGG